MDNEAKLLIENIDVRQDGQFVGYASVFGTKNGYGTIIDKGAFADVIKTARPAITFNHRSPVGHIVAVMEDDKGLLVHGQLWLDTEAGKIVYKLIKTSDYKMSCHCLSASYVDGQGNTHFSRVTRFYDATITNNPAEPNAEILFVHDAEGGEQPAKPDIDPIREAENRGYQAGFATGYQHGERAAKSSGGSERVKRIGNKIDAITKKYSSK